MWKTSVNHTLRSHYLSPFVVKGQERRELEKIDVENLQRAKKQHFIHRFLLGFTWLNCILGQFKKKKNLIWLLIIKNNPRSMSCYALPSCLDAFHYCLKGHILKTLLEVKQKKIKWFRVFFKAVAKTETNVIFNLWLTVNWQDMNMNFTK